MISKRVTSNSGSFFIPLCYNLIMELATSLYETLGAPDGRQLALFIGAYAVAIFLTREDR